MLNQGSNYRLHSRITMIFLVIAIVSTVSYLAVMHVVLNKMQAAMLDTLLGHELEELVVELSKDPDTPMPDTVSVKAYLMSRGHLKPIPGYLKDRNPDVYHEIQVGEKIYQAIIVELENDRLYVSFDITTMSKNHSALHLLIICGGLLSVTVLAVSGFWLFRKFLLPVSNLAYEVSNIDPNDRKVRIEDHYRGLEVGLIARSIDQYLSKLDDFVEREQSFTAAVSHELRTPISVIATSAELFEVKGVTDEQQEIIDRIQESTTYMAGVIEALLFFARGTHSVTEKTLPEIYLHKNFLKVLKSYENSASEKKLDLVFKRKARIKVRISESHISIILGNLIRNAIANADTGEVIVTLFENGFSVKDAGRGIESDEIDLIVNYNYHSPDSSGFGLGLYVVKNVCDAYGLKLEIESAIGQGSEFIIYFPENMLEH